MSPNQVDQHPSWVTDRNPTVDQSYVVKIEVRAFHFLYPGIRKWKDGKWGGLTPNEVVIKWLDGVEL